VFTDDPVHNIFLVCWYYLVLLVARSARAALPRNQLQLIGVTSLWVAAKIEEIYPPRASGTLSRVAEISLKSVSR